MFSPIHGEYDGHPAMPPAVYWLIVISVLISLCCTLFVFLSFALFMRKKSTQEQRTGVYVCINDTFMVLGGLLFASFDGKYLRNYGVDNPRCMAAGFCFFFAGVNQLSFLFLFSFTMYKRIVSNKRILTEKQTLLICYSFSFIVCFLPFWIPQIKYGPVSYWCIIDSDRSFWGLIFYFLVTSFTTIGIALAGFTFLIYKIRQIVKQTSHFKNVKQANTLLRMSKYPIAVALIYLPIVVYHIAEFGFAAGSSGDFAFMCISGVIHGLSGLVNLVIYNKNVSLIPAWKKFYDQRMGRKVAANVANSKDSKDSKERTSKSKSSNSYSDSDDEKDSKTMPLREVDTTNNTDGTEKKDYLKIEVKSGRGESV